MLEQANQLKLLLTFRQGDHDELLTLHGTKPSQKHAENYQTLSQNWLHVFCRHSPCSTVAVHCETQCNILKLRISVLHLHLHIQLQWDPVHALINFAKQSMCLFPCTYILLAVLHPVHLKTSICIIMLVCI